MNKSAIIKTAIEQYDSKEDLFIVQSPLLDICTGAAKNKKEAWQIFHDLLNSMYIKYLEGKKVGRYKSPGRPAKNRLGFACQIKPTTKRSIQSMAKKLEISQGEVIDYLLRSHQAHK